MRELCILIGVAVEAITRNEMRWALPALGIIVGVACVIAMIGVGEGSQAALEASTPIARSTIRMIHARTPHGMPSQEESNEAPPNDRARHRPLGALTASLPASHPSVLQRTCSGARLRRP